MSGYTAPQTDGIFPGVNYRVVGTSGDITYNGSTIAIGSEFVGVDGVNDYTINSGDAAAEPFLKVAAVTVEAATTEDERLANINEVATLQAVTLEAATTADEKRMQDVYPSVKAVCIEFLPPRYLVKKKFNKTNI